MNENYKNFIIVNLSHVSYNFFQINRSHEYNSIYDDKIHLHIFEINEIFHVFIGLLERTTHTAQHTCTCTYY